MPSHQETRYLPYTAEQMYAVVADVEHYPEFLPWCTSLRVLSRAKEEGADIVTAEMTAAYRGLRERYVSRVRLDPRARTIEAVHIEGPFARLINRWRFESLTGGCRVEFFIDFAFKSRLLSALIGVAFGRVAMRMTDAFDARAHALYGRSDQLVQPRDRRLDRG